MGMHLKLILHRTITISGKRSFDCIQEHRKSLAVVLRRKRRKRSEKNMSGAEPESNTRNAIPYDYGRNKKSDYGKVPKFNGDPEEFSW
ncbi:hypothetical protein MTR_7g046960 [Medicago truncatula]|uniref:Uncharacterized protein n=1 Tax=Medicago truncatula TaxID=3880 RepID=G7KUZ2_MEDTR|nr:hypothetical protein MTR_7g046960 [Medicago truncatula]